MPIILLGWRDVTISHLELVPPTCTSAALEGLDPGRLYQFRIYSENAAGMSDALIGPRSVCIRAGIRKFVLFLLLLLFVPF